MWVSVPVFKAKMSKMIFGMSDIDICTFFDSLNKKTILCFCFLLLMPVCLQNIAKLNMLDWLLLAGWLFRDTQIVCLYVSVLDGSHGPFLVTMDFACTACTGLTDLLCLMLWVVMHALLFLTEIWDKFNFRNKFYYTAMQNHGKTRRTKTVHKIAKGHVRFIGVVIL